MQILLYNILKIQDQNVFGNLSSIPIIFVEEYLAQNLPNSDVSKSGHLFVLVHGYQGNALDIKTYKNCLYLRYPDASFLCSTINENKTDENIKVMGERLAEEIRRTIMRLAPNIIYRISFIGHSMGGLIMRACLPFLEVYKSKMHTFLTFSSPHLGLFYPQSKLVRIGMSLMNSLSSSSSIDELLLNDTKNPFDSYLYKLSKENGLNWFKNVVLVSSFQDTYSPYESAKIEICLQALEDKNE